MPTLTNCLRKVSIDAEDKAAIQEAARALKKKGASQADASLQAVDKRIAEVERMAKEWKPAPKEQPKPEPVAKAEPAPAAPEPEVAAPAAEVKPESAAEPVKEEAKAEPKKPTKIDDFGEKLTGARKEYAAALKDRMTEAAAVDISAEPLSKSWPEPDYAKLLEGGADPWMVSFVHAARDEVPTKPQTSWKLKGWVENVKLLRDVSARLLDGSITREAVEAKLWMPEFRYVRTAIGGRAELYREAGHERSLKGVTLQEHHYSLYRGQENVRKWVVEQKAKATMFSNWPRELAVADTKDEALTQFKAKLASLDLGTKAKGQPQFVIYRKRGQEGAWIGKKIGREYVDLKRVDDVTQARKYMAENTAELEALLASYKETPLERRPDNQPRVGDDHRNGAPVTPEAFADAFGFRGVQFGNYVEQGRRQSDLNEAFDALMDMAAVLGIPARALSLNGRLGLAFGARGRGGKNAPAAHFEPGKVVINLTKGGGPGSLAHEWWHSLDNYFAGDGSRFVTAGARAEMRDQMRTAFEAVKKATQAKGLMERSRDLDARRSGPYWGTAEELSARSFETYVIAKLEDQGAANDYLANVVSQQAWDVTEGMRSIALGKDPDAAASTYPYPTADEMPAVRAAFDEFFRVIETKQDEAGNVALFSRADDPKPDRGTTGLTLAEAQAILALPRETLDAVTGRRLTVERAQELAKAIGSGANVVQSVDDMPQALRDALLDKAPDGRVRGAYFKRNDSVWLVLDNVHSEAEASFVMLHESFHRGLAKTIGPEAKKALRWMHATNASLREATKVQMERHGIGEDEAIEEALADMAGEGKASSLRGWGKLVAMVREWLAKIGDAIGMPIKWSDEMIAEFVAGTTRAGLEVHTNPAVGDVTLSRATAQDLAPADGGVFDFNRLGATQQDRIRTVVDGARPFWLGALTRDQIADIYGKDIPAVKEYDTLTRAMENQRSKIAQDADTLYSEWAKLGPAVNDKLARVMLDATVHSAHPDDAFTTMKGNTAEQEAERKAVHARISAEFKALPAPAQAMYKRVRDFHSGMLEQLKTGLEARIERQVQDGKARAATLTSIRQAFDKYKESGPYFPLSRFGDFLVIGTRADGERVVASYETAGEQATAARALRKDGFTVKTKTAKDYSRALDGSAGRFAGDVLTMLNDLDMAEATVGGKAADLKSKLMDDVNQLFIRALPDLSYRKHFAHRKNTPGFSSDMMRGFASSAFHAASHIARLNHADQMSFALEDAFKTVERVEEGDFNQQTQVLNELAQRHDASMNPNTHPIAAMLNQVGFVMYLGASPAAGLVNLLQTPMVTLPYLGARHGFGKASAAMGKATKDIMGAKANRSSGWNAVDSPKLTQAERDTMRKLQDEGVIDLTQAHDLSAATGLDTGNVARSKAAFAMARAMKIVGWTFHVPEVMNRQVTALTAYRLEMAKGSSQEQAEEAAREAIKRTHFDYSASNRARYMQGNVARVLLQFKQYAQNMTYLLGRAGYQAMKGETPEVRAIARRQLVGTLAATFTMAGALGLPGLGAAAGLIGMLAGAFDDDDKPWDWKVEFRNLMADTFGKEAGEVIAHGVPRALMPWDLAGRVGMGDLWFRSSDREGQSPREAFADDLKNILGPTAGTLLGLYTATDHMARGNWMKAAEAMVPKAVRDPIQAVRIASEGVTSYTGDHLMDVTEAEVIGRALGFTPARMSEMYEGRNAVKNAETAVMERRKFLIGKAARARMENDAEEGAEAREQIAEFNRRNPREAIKPESIAASVMARRRHERQTQDGTYLPKNRDHLRQVGRFAAAE